MHGRQQKKCSVKNQHYVPQFYLRNFSKDNKTVGTFILKSCQYVKSASIKHQSCGDYFYSTNCRVEMNLGEIEKDAKRVIDLIIKNPKEKLSKEDAYSLYLFTMIQQGRTLANAKSIQKHANVTIREVLKIKKEKGNLDGIEEFNDADIEDFKIEANHPGGLSLVAQIPIVNTCVDLQYKILINSSCTPFITSDNPVAIYDTFIERMNIGMYALASRGLQMFMPLNAWMAVFYYDPACYKIGERRKCYVEVDESGDICELNRLTVLNAESVVYFEPESMNEEGLKTLIVKNRNENSVKDVISFQDRSEDNKITVMTYHKPILCKLSLSFVKELPCYRTLTPKDFRHEKHCYREIAFYKDEIARQTVGDSIFK